MKFPMFSRVHYKGPGLPHDQLKSGDIGFIIEDFGDGNVEV